MAAQEWEFSRQLVETEIFQREKMTYPPCGKNPVCGSSDANLKFRHLESAGSARKQENQIEGLD